MYRAMCDYVAHHKNKDEAARAMARDYKGTKTPDGAKLNFTTIRLAMCRRLTMCGGLPLSGHVIPALPDSVAQGKETRCKTVFSASKAQEPLRPKAMATLTPFTTLTSKPCRVGKPMRPKATLSCKALCRDGLPGQAGTVANEADLNSVRKSRIAKARRFMLDRFDYMANVVRSIQLAHTKAKRMGLALCVRHTTQAPHIAWEGIPASAMACASPTDWKLSPVSSLLTIQKSQRAYPASLPPNSIT